MSWAEVKDINSNPNKSLDKLIGTNVGIGSIMESKINNFNNCNSKQFLEMNNITLDKFDFEVTCKDSSGTYDMDLGSECFYIYYNSIMYIIGCNVTGVYVINTNTNEQTYIYSYNGWTTLDSSVPPTRYSIQSSYSIIGGEYHDYYSYRHFSVFSVKKGTYQILVSIPFHCYYGNNKYYYVMYTFIGYVKFNDDGSFSYGEQYTNNTYENTSSSTNHYTTYNINIGNLRLSGRYLSINFFSNSRYLVIDIVTQEVLYNSGSPYSSSANTLVFPEYLNTNNLNSYYDNRYNYNNQLSYYDESKNISYGITYNGVTIIKNVQISSDGKTITGESEFINLIDDMGINNTDKFYYNGTNSYSGIYKLTNSRIINGDLLYFPPNYFYTDNTKLGNGEPFIIRNIKDDNRKLEYILHDDARYTGYGQMINTDKWLPDNYTKYCVSGFGNLCLADFGSSSYVYSYKKSLQFRCEDEYIFPKTIKVSKNRVIITYLKFNSIEDIKTKFSKWLGVDVTVQVTKGMKLIFDKSAVLSIEGDYEETDFGCIATNNGQIKLLRGSMIDLPVTIAY